MILPLLLFIYFFFFNASSPFLTLSWRLVAYKRERLVFSHRSPGSWEGKHQEENIILCGSILDVTNHERRDTG